MTRRPVALLLSAALAASACRKESPGGAAADAGATATPLVFAGDAPGLLLTFVDEQGEFHVVERASEVPTDRAARVRVVLADRPETTSSEVYVADLGAPLPDGRYSASAMTRAEWDEQGARRRTKRLEALSPGAPRPSPSGSAPPPSDRAAAVRATIYGASWCGPCHQAEALLKSLGVPVVMKDVEETPGAQAEMQALLRKVHRSGGSIPVIEISGQVLVGFSDQAIRRVVERARAGAL